MAHQVCWTRQIIEEFAELALLNADEIAIVNMRAKGLSIVQQSMELQLSESTINKITQKLKHKYDAVQPHSKYMPPRKFTSKETYTYDGG